MPTGSFQTCHCGGAMRKLRGLQTLSPGEGGREGWWEVGDGGGHLHGITSRPCKCFGKSRGSGCALVFPLTRLYMCAVIRLPAPEGSAWFSTAETDSHIRGFYPCFLEEKKRFSVCLYATSKWIEVPMWEECDELRNGFICWRRVNVFSYVPWPSCKQTSSTAYYSLLQMHFEILPGHISGIWYSLWWACFCFQLFLSVWPLLKVTDWMSLHCLFISLPLTSA